MPERLIEDFINERLSGETHKSALDLVAFMRANEFTFDGFGDGDDVGWNPAYGGRHFGCMMVRKIASDEEEFWVWFGLEFDFGSCNPDGDDLKETAWAHVVNCPQEKYCKPPYCQETSEHPGSKNRYTIFGKEYESTCHAPMAFTNPDAKTLEHIKKLMLLIKQNWN